MNTVKNKAFLLPVIAYLVCIFLPSFFSSGWHLLLSLVISVLLLLAAVFSAKTADSKNQKEVFIAAVFAAAASNNVIYFYVLFTAETAEFFKLWAALIITIAGVVLIFANKFRPLIAALCAVLCFLDVRFSLLLSAFFLAVLITAADAEKKKDRKTAAALSVCCAVILCVSAGLLISRGELDYMDKKLFFLRGRAAIFFFVAAIYAVARFLKSTGGKKVGVLAAAGVLLAVSVISALFANINQLALSAFFSALFALYLAANTELGALVKSDIQNHKLIFSFLAVLMLL